VETRRRRKIKKEFTGLLKQRINNNKKGKEKMVKRKDPQLSLMSAPLFFQLREHIPNMGDTLQHVACE